MGAESLTKCDKRDRVVEWLAHQHLANDGGYPAATLEHNHHLYVVRSGGNEDEEIWCFPLRSLPKLYDYATAYIRENGLSEEWPDIMRLSYGDWDEAFWEVLDIFRIRGQSK